MPRIGDMVLPRGISGHVGFLALGVIQSRDYVTQEETDLWIWRPTLQRVISCSAEPVT